MRDRRCNIEYGDIRLLEFPPGVAGAFFAFVRGCATPVIPRRWIFNNCGGATVLSARHNSSVLSTPNFYIMIYKDTSPTEIFGAIIDIFRTSFWTFSECLIPLRTLFNTRLLFLRDAISITLAVSRYICWVFTVQNSMGSRGTRGGPKTLFIHAAAYHGRFCLYDSDYI